MLPAIKIGLIGLSTAFLSACAIQTPPAHFSPKTTVTSPPSAALLLNETLPFGLSATDVATVVTEMGIPVVGAGNANYQLAITFAIRSDRLGSFIRNSGERDWVSRPNQGLRSRIAKRSIVRVSIVLTDAHSKAVVWRSSGQQRPGADAKARTLIALRAALAAVKTP